MRCSSDVVKKTSPLDVFGDVSEKVKHLTNDASNDVRPPALAQGDKKWLILRSKSGNNGRVIQGSWNHHENSLTP